MSHQAVETNCVVCPHRAALRAGKIRFENRPCPTLTPPGRKRPVKLTQETVRAHMPKGWRCPERASK